MLSLFKLLSLNRIKMHPVIIISILTIFFPSNTVASEISKTFDSANYRGINVYMHSNPTDVDFNTLSKWGVNTIRLFIHANPDRRDYDHIYQKDSDLFNEKAFLKIDRILDMAAKHSIKVIIATATFQGFREHIWDDYSYWVKLENLYIYITHRYKKHSAVIGYHPIDEPSLLRKKGSTLDRVSMRKGHWKFPYNWRGTPKDYFGLVEKVGQTINKIDSNKIVVVSGVGIWGFADNFGWMEPVNVRNAFYAFNPYIPHRFANSGKKGRPKVSYNSKLERTKLLEKMRPVQIFAKKYNAKIIVIGFGLPLHTEGMGARDWMNDMLGFFEDNDWSWTYFSYGIPFRSPEVVKRIGKKREWQRSENTERLSVLKEYWKLNSSSSPISQ